jgi:hypothetical protein
MAKGRRNREMRRPPAAAAHAETRRGPSSPAWGARVARVAVDDETWATFRELCGATPASVRLGELVRAEVARAQDAQDPTVDAIQALRAIGHQAQAVEAYLRASSAPPG